MKKIDKLLVLDIDGVVNCKYTAERHGPFIGIDPEKAKLIQRIIAETNCSVVLSSTWRLDPDSCKEVREKVCDFIDTTPNLGKDWRGDEVIQWLNNNNVDRYAILDDNSDFYFWQPLFKTTWEEGLTDKIADDVIKHLNKANS